MSGQGKRVCVTGASGYIASWLVKFLLLFNCPFTTEVWNAVRTRFGIPVEAHNLHNAWHWMSIHARGDKAQDKAKIFALSATIYLLWHARNAKVHDGNFIPREVITKQIISHVFRILFAAYPVSVVSDPKKVEHLLALDGAKEKLHLFEADLMEEGSFDSAVSGCDGVFHTASPCFFESRDPEVELLEPAVKGTLNVLGSCARVGTVKRVVLTSSTSAVLGNNREITPDVIVDESWFSDPDYRRREKNWYALSKTLAGEAAWKYAKEKGMDLVCINPGFVLGPLLQPTLNESCAMLLDLIKGGKASKNIGYRTVNVKDVASAHIKAFEKVSAFGRYCLVESTVPFFDALKILQELYPTLQLPNKSEKDDPPIIFQVSREKAESLGIEFTPLRTTLKETVDSLKEKNFTSF